jgi:hypothetical protein
MGAKYKDCRSYQPAQHELWLLFQLPYLTYVNPPDGSMGSMGTVLLLPCLGLKDHILI